MKFLSDTMRDYSPYIEHYHNLNDKVSQCKEGEVPVIGMYFQRNLEAGQNPKTYNLPTYGGEFQALVDSMLVIDPDDRISSRASARRSLAWWCCAQPLAGSVQPSSASQHTQPLAGPPLAGSVQPSSASQPSQPLAGPA